MLQAIRVSGGGMRSTLSGRESAVATRYVRLKQPVTQPNLGCVYTCKLNLDLCNIVSCHKKPIRNESR